MVDIPDIEDWLDEKKRFRPIPDHAWKGIAEEIFKELQEAREAVLVAAFVGGLLGAAGGLIISIPLALH